jgi:hypothetical protein
MREKTIKLYTFDELTDQAKQKAIEWYRSINDEIFWQSETFDSLKAVFERVGIRIRDYDLGIDGYSYIRFDLNDSIAELKGVRAFTWLENNLFSKLRLTRNAYLKNRKNNLKYGYKVNAIPSCPLTGYYADETFLESLKKDALNGNTLKECFQHLALVYVNVLQSEYDYQNSAEYITETIQCNQYEFLEDGTRA